MKKGNKFEKEHGGLYERIWGKEIEGKDHVSIS